MLGSKNLQVSRRKPGGFFHLSLILLLLGWLSGCGKSPTAEFREGEELLEAGRYAEAAKKLEEAARALETNVTAWNKLGLAFQYQGKFVEAQSAYETAIQIDPTFPDVYYNLGNMFLDSNQLRAAVNHLQNYTFMVQSPQGYLSLAIAQRRSRDYAKAIMNLKSAEALAPDDLSIQHELALTHYENLNPDTAQQYLDAILEKDSEFAPAVLTKAIISQSQDEDRNITIDLYNRYLELNPSREMAEKVHAIIDTLKMDLASGDTKDPLPTRDPETVKTNLTDIVVIDDPGTNILENIDISASKTNTVSGEVVVHGGQTNTTEEIAISTNTTEQVDVVDVNIETEEPGETGDTIPVEPETTTTIPEEPQVGTAGLPEPDLDVQPGKAVAKPEIPKAYGFTKSVNGKKFLVIPAKPEPVETPMSPASDAQLNYPYREIEELLEANKQVLAAYGISMPESPGEVPDGFYRNAPVPSGVTPLEPLPPPDPEKLSRVAIGQPGQYSNPTLINPSVNLGSIDSGTPRVYAETGDTGSAIRDIPGGLADIGDFPEIPEGIGSEPIRQAYPEPISLNTFPKYNFVLTSPPSSGDRNAARPFFLDGVQAYKAGQAQLAIDFFTNAIANDPAYYEAQFNLGLLYLKSKQTNQALMALEKARALRPDNLEITYHVGRALSLGGYIGDAVGEYKKVIESDPGHYRAHLSLAKTYEEKVRDIANAAFHYEQVLALYPSHPEATNIRYWLRANK